MARARDMAPMLTQICPPPQTVGGEVGETRTVKFNAAALHFGEEIDMSRFQEG